MASTSATNPDTLVTVKVNIDGSNRRFKLPLRELGANALPDKLRFLLAIPPTADVLFERYSDSAASFVVLDSNNAAVYKQLYRAAKAKLKLRLRVTVSEKGKEPMMPRPATVEDEVLDATEEQLDSHRYTSPASPPQEPATVDTGIKETSQSPSVAGLQREFEDLLLNHAAYNAPGATRCGLPGQFGRQTSPLPMPTLFPSCTKSHACSNTDIPVNRSDAALRERLFAELAGVSQERQNAIRSRCGPLTPQQISTYSVFCNNCNQPIPDEHYHCSTCDDGDFDLCQECVDDGVLCGGEGHWMIKRFVKNGKIINSVTERIAPRSSYSESKTTLVPIEETRDTPTRTCNSCIQEFPEDHFVTCMACEDFDLCIPCHVSLGHGHDPKHAFGPAVDGMPLEPIAQALLPPGRNASHQAICDGCDKYIYGVRHKCLDCPDWDYCSTCIANAKFIHPRHRFVPIYEPLHDSFPSVRSFGYKVQHTGIYCDGPLCVSKSAYIVGDRYKCAVCHDTDFCANCEASPSNLHNKTHPLIKFKTPVRNVSVTTMGDHDNGLPMPLMGDRRGRTTSKSTETTPAPSANAATQVQTVADLKPSEPVKVETAPETTSEKNIVQEDAVEEAKTPNDEELVAHFVRDAVPDGSVYPPNTVFEQTWILRNGGTKPWPAGCTVKFVGGDNMCAVDPEHPASVHELVAAAESTTCYTEVAPGQECGFTVLMRTPNRSGKVISYWRLTGPTGYKFGHRLWCDVTVSQSKFEVKEDIKEEVKEEVKEAPVDPVASQMIFPKLEKESPTTSIHEETPRDKEPTDADDFEQVEDDNELDEDDSEDGFLTDEEYDILDASDEEYLAQQEKAAKK